MLLSVGRSNSNAWIQDVVVPFWKPMYLVSAKFCEMVAVLENSSSFCKCLFHQNAIGVVVVVPGQGVGGLQGDREREIG